MLLQTMQMIRNKTHLRSLTRIGLDRELCALRRMHSCYPPYHSRTVWKTASSIMMTSRTILICV